MTWNIENNSLVREFEFANFSETIGFVNKILPLAEAANHHPDVLIHSYKKVRIMLSSHDEGMVTEKDYALAREIDAM